VFRFHEGTLNLAACGLIAAAGLAAYANTFEAPFVFDGLPLEDRLRALTWNPAEWFGTNPRTIGFFTFDLQYTLHGRWLPGFHAGNIAIHVVAALALFGAVLVTCRGPRMPAAVQRDSAGIALVSALLFELHPLQTQAVTYLYQRFESLMGMFFLLSVFCFVMAVRNTTKDPPRRIGWFLAAWAAVILSIGTKEVGAVAPLVLLWYDRVFAATSWPELWTRRRWFYLPFFAVFAAGAAYLYAQRAHYAAGGIFDLERMSPLTYALTQPEVILRYLRLTLWPRGLCLDWALPPAHTAVRIVPPLLALITLLGWTGWATVRLPAVGFLLGSFFLILAPTSSFAPIIDVAFEHRMYLPLAPLAVLTVLGARAGLRWLALRLGAHPPAVRAILATGALTVAVALGATTFLRNEIYRSGVTLWKDVVEKVPGNPRGYSSLAWHVEQETGDDITAIRLNERALQLDPTIPTAHRGLAILLYKANRPRAIRHAREAVRIERNADNLNNLGIVIAETAPAEAEDCFREAMALDGRLTAAKLNLGKLLTMTGRRSEAGELLGRPLGPDATPRHAAERAAPPAIKAP
jgi:tetratricopeptide (TPR) repeat protein